MNDEGRLEGSEAELDKFPSALGIEFKRSRKLLEGRLSQPELLLWLQEGLAIAGHAFRAWEASVEFFKASPKVSELLAFPHLMAWARYGRSLLEDSALLCSAFFRSSPGALAYIPPHHMGEWSQMGKSLYKGTWKSISLSTSFFDLSPRMLRYMTLADTRRFVAFVDALSQKSYDLSNECLNLADKVLPRIEKQDLGPFFSLITALLDSNWRDARNCFEAGGKVLGRVERSQRGRFLEITERAARKHGALGISLFMDASRSIDRVDPSLHGHLLDLSEILIQHSDSSAVDFLKNSFLVLSKIRGAYLDLWFQEGLKLVQENPESGLAFFRLESARSEELLESLSSAVELERVREVLGMYSRALTGIDVQIMATSDLTERGVGWSSLEKPLTEGNAVVLPALVERYESKNDNFSWFKVMATHQLAHQEFGTFGFSFAREGMVFPNLREELSAARQQKNGTLNDLQKFIALFPDRKLALDIFTTVEDGRTDFQAKRNYGGLRAWYGKVQDEAIGERPDLTSLPLRESLMELLIRLSLEDKASVAVPQEILPYLEPLAGYVKGIQSADASVEDSAEAAIRIYQLLSQIPNVESQGQNSDEVDLSELSGEAGLEDLEELLENLQRNARSDRSSQGETDSNVEQPYRSPRDVSYRGEVKPELAQLLANLTKNQQKQEQSRGPRQMPAPGREQAQGKASSAEAGDLEEEDLSSYADLFVDTLLNDLIRNQANYYQDPGYWHDTRDEDQNPLQINEPNSFIYDEWDFRAGDYKPRWCCVREKRMEEGTEEFYTKTLENYAILASQIKRHFEMMSPEMLRKVKRLPDGEEFDFDAVIDSIVQRKSGGGPSEKVYWRRNKVQRDVAMSFLLDMSASTAEAIEETRKNFDRWDSTDNPRDYLTWLRSRREDPTRRAYKRIIDVEKESIVLLIRALETIGDKYGIYAFSGYGRENVEFYVIKDMEEGFTTKVKRRIDKMTPLHATRMGPAIRHAAAKLEKVEAKTKILFLLSDGRPQDRGYSREGVEKEYAVHDTKMALMEARRKSINPFCITVDRAGHDYLRTMCQDMAYEVVEDITSLPRRLPLLYRRLTV